MSTSKTKKRKRTSRKKYVEAPLHHVVTLHWKAPEAREVCLAGTFNNWDPSDHPMKRSRNGVWSITLEFDRDDHEYKFVVDGEWVHDDLNPEYVVNVFGTRNSILPDA